MTANSGYNGNQFLKKVGTEHEFTKEQIQEYIKCKKDTIYFIKNYCKIVTLDHGLQLFDPYDYQIRMAEAFDSHRFVVNLLPRQMGKTTIVAAYLLHYVIFNADKAIGILANKAAMSREILSRIQRMFENLPQWLKPGVKEWNKGSVVLGNNSWIIAAATSSDSVRGFSFNMILLDEFAFVDQQTQFWESTYPVISASDNSKVIITSTPKGLDLFYKIYTDAENGLNDFHPIRAYWWEHPKRDENWKRVTLSNIGEEQFRQEFEAEFIGSSSTLIAGSKLKQLVHTKPNVNKGGICQYEEPISSHSYVITVDVSRGKGLDHSAFQVIDVTEMPYKQVCTFHDNMTMPMDFANIIYRFGVLYNDALVLVEINDIGEQVSSSLFDDYEYENLLFTENKGRGGKQLTMAFASNADKGVRTTKTVKSVGCSVLKMLVEQDQLILHDFDTISELSTFSQRGTSWEAEPGKHDDLVMCLVLFAWLSNQKFFKDLTDINTLSNLRDQNEEEMMENLLPFGIIDTGHDMHEEEHRQITYF